MRKFAPVSYPPLGSAALAAQKQVGNVETRNAGDLPMMLDRDDYPINVRS